MIIHLKEENKDDAKKEIVPIFSEKVHKSIKMKNFLANSQIMINFHRPNGSDSPMRSPNNKPDVLQCNINENSLIQGDSDEE